MVDSRVFTVETRMENYQTTATKEGVLLDEILEASCNSTLFQTHDQIIALVRSSHSTDHNTK